MGMDFASLQAAADRLLLYQGVWADDPGRHWRDWVATEGDPVAYGAWVHSLADRGQGWQEYLATKILLDDNPFSRSAQGGEVPEPLRQAALQDLACLQSIYQVAAGQLARWGEHHPWVDVLAANPDPWVRRWQQTANWRECLPELIDHYRQWGTGLFGAFRALRWQGGQLQGIHQPDRVALGDLVGYDWQRRALVANTEALVAGYPALNVLLYGARGCGKSSLVKALLPSYESRGLRLVEVAKHEAYRLPELLPLLQLRSQKFILFIDDLSFEADEAAFKALKVVLEGSAVGRPSNVVVYATSNRRHLVREFFADRPRPQDQDEIHRWDTVQEQLSFSDRFGLTLTFEPADQDTYLQMVRHWARDLPISPEDLDFRARQWAIQQNGRSGRTARQFVDFLRADLTLF